MQKKNRLIELFALFVLVIGIYFFATYHEQPKHGNEAVPETVTPVPFTQIAAGTQSSITERTNYIIATQYGLEKVWKLAGLTAALPEVDFDKNAVIAVFAGQKGSGGYTIEISGVQDSATGRMVTIELRVPEKGCSETQALTSPYQFVTVPVTTLALDHEDVISATECK